VNWNGLALQRLSFAGIPHGAVGEKLDEVGAAITNAPPNFNERKIISSGRPPNCQCLPLNSQELGRCRFVYELDNLFYIFLLSILHDPVPRLVAVDAVT
jgi:hypothetical protein